MMKPEAYVDIELRAGMGVTIPVLAGQVVQALHPGFQQSPGQFALAFPDLKVGETPTPGHRVRVFALSRAGLETLLDGLETPSRKDWLHVGRIRAVPQDWGGSWVAYERFRIPSRQGKGTPAQQEKRARLRRQRFGAARSLAFLKVHSASTGQLAVVTFHCRRQEKPGEAGLSDGYGLSRPSSQVWLPALED
jgi:CRISPR-associated endoribonuclease Cas6/Csy4 subtype I-F